jgi:phenylalanyl-tRNA synthetase beta chain
MPVVTFDYNDYINLLGYEISKDELLERLPMIGADLDKVQGDEISFEFFPNRPDLTSVEGIARASRAFFGFEKGMKTYPIENSNIVMNVDPSVNVVRPYVVTALVKNITMSDEFIASLMDMQEKLHFGLGRNRKKVAIGVHNFDTVQPPFTYKGVDPGSVQFVPLAKVESMTLRDILKKHEKGIDYAHLLDGFDVYPLIVDAKNNVLSFPPIINGILTEVTPFTENLFIDITGLDKKAIHCALNIVTTALAERGGKIFTTTVKYTDKSEITPDLSPTKKDLSADYVNKILGTNMKTDEITECLLKMGYKTNIGDSHKISVEVPAWRTDILHDIDLVEDVAVGYGYDRFNIDFPKTLTFGKVLPRNHLYEAIRTVMIGLGFNEVTTFTLSNERDEFTKMGLKLGNRTEIANPIGEDYSCLRLSLIPSMLKLLAENRHHPLPQQIYEVGIVADEKFKNTYHTAGIKIDAKANFTECKSIIEAIFRDLGLDYKISEKNHPAFVQGRSATVLIKDKERGYFGEIHPKTITSFELEHPIVAFEIHADGLVDYQ